MAKVNISKYVLPSQATEASAAGGEENPNRVTVGQVFIQPTGGKGTKPLNFTYGYYGMMDASGKFVAGFSMPNIKMLEAVEAGMLPKAFATCFDAYAAKHMASGHAVIKAS